MGRHFPASELQTWHCVRFTITILNVVCKFADIFIPASELQANLNLQSCQDHVLANNGSKRWAVFQISSRNASCITKLEAVLVQVHVSRKRFLRGSSVRAD